jgi:two-component system cell cycle response regulator
MLTAMADRIGFVSSMGSTGLCEAVRPLLPPGTTLEFLSIENAMRLVVSGKLTVLIIAVDSPSWHDAIGQLSELQRAAEMHPLAVLALVPRDDPAALVKAFELHVADVAGLPMDPHEVRARLAALVRRRHVAFAKAAETRRAWRQAVLDPVTGLYNRHHLDSVLPAAIESARRGGRPLAVLMIDVDSLKPLNDRWGHAAGDRVLRAVADTLKARMRNADTVARYGGDEIVAVLPDTDHRAALAIAADLVNTVASMVCGRLGDGPAHVTISIGLAALCERDTDVDMLLNRADTALYAAKGAGRNRVAQAA